MNRFLAYSLRKHCISFSQRETSVPFVELTFYSWKSLCYFEKWDQSVFLEDTRIHVSVRVLTSSDVFVVTRLQFLFDAFQDALRAFSFAFVVRSSTGIRQRFAAKLRTYSAIVSAMKKNTRIRSIKKKKKKKEKASWPLWIRKTIWNIIQFKFKGN